MCKFCAFFTHKYTLTKLISIYAHTSTIVSVKFISNLLDIIATQIDCYTE